MKLRKRTYTPPPDAIYHAGKRKAALTKAHRLLRSLWTEFNGDDLKKIDEVILIIKKKRQQLDEDFRG